MGWTQRANIKNRGLWFVTGAIVVSGLAAITYLKSQQSQATPKGFVRNLATIERWYSAHESAGRLAHFVVGYCFDSKEVWTIEYVQQLLQRVCVSHPQTLCTIVDADGVPSDAPPGYWKRLFSTEYSDDEQGYFDIRHVERPTKDPQDETWVNVSKAIELEGFVSGPPNRAIFKLVIISTPNCTHWELVMCCHHALFCARSAIRFIQSLLECHAALRTKPSSAPPIANLKLQSIRTFSTFPEFAKAESEKTANPENHSNILNWIPPTESMVNLFPGWLTIAKALFYDKFPSFNPYKQAWIGPAEIPGFVRPRQSHCSIFSIPAASLEKLKLKCKEEMTTVTAALWAAVDFGLLDLYSKLNAEGMPQTGVQWFDQGKLVVYKLCPFDLRPIFGISSHWTAPFVTSVDSLWTIDTNETFWNSARRMKAELRDGQTTGIQKLGLIPYIGRQLIPWVKQKLDGCPNGQTETFRVSNLGVMEVESQYENVKVKSAWFGRSGPSEGQYIMMQAVTPNEHSDLNIWISYLPELIEGRHFDTFKDTFLSSLDHCIFSDVDFSYNDYCNSFRIAS